MADTHRFEQPYAETGPVPQLPAPLPFNVRPAGQVRPDQSLCIARSPDSVAAQQYRLLRHRLKESSDPRIVGVTSPRPGEGKSMVAANLGLALTEGRRVRIMLLDLNLRQPQLATKFGLTAPGSVAEQLRRKHRNAGALWDVLELGNNLHLIAGDAAVENPAPLLNSDELAVLFDDLAQHYDYVLVDLPAVLIAADVKSVQDSLDSVVMVCRAGNSTKAQLSRAVDQLGTSRLHGVLMLDVHPRYMPT